jgi:hypothetical protein
MITESRYSIVELYNLFRMAPAGRNRELKLLPDAKVAVVVLDSEAKKAIFEPDDLAIVMINPTSEELEGKNILAVSHLDRDYDKEMVQACKQRLLFKALAI